MPDLRSKNFLKLPLLVQTIKHIFQVTYTCKVTNRQYFKKIKIPLRNCKSPRKTFVIQVDTSAVYTVFSTLIRARYIMYLTKRRL